MGDEKADYQIWLDEYLDDMGGIQIGPTASDGGWVDYQDWIVGNYDKPNHDNITLTGGGEEMLRIDKDGFYVRGVRVEADAKEAEQVYKAFKQWLTWANLSKNNEE